MPNRSVYVSMIARVEGYIAPVKAAQRATVDFARDADKAVKSGKKGWDELSRGAGVAGAAMVLGVGMAVRAFARFDQAMSKVAAAGKDYANNLDALRATALQAGRDTKFSATEAAAGEEALAKAGVSAADIIGGGLKGALDLAASGNLSVADSAEVAASAMVTFGLKGGQVSHVADVLAAAAGKAQGEVSDMGAALRQSSAIAAQLGLSIEDTAGALAMFANAGITGSDAGTSFKQMLLMMVAPTDTAAALIKKYGLAFFDAGGTMKSFSAIAEELRTKLGGLTQQEQGRALKVIFGADAYRVAAIAMKGGAAAADSWRAAVDDAGYASDAAAKRTDNLAGDFERLTGSLETGLIQAASGSNGALRGLTQGADRLVSTFLGMPDVVQQSAFWLTAISGTALGALGAFGTLAPKVHEARQALVDIGPAGARANTVLGKVGKAAGAAAGAFAALEIAGAITHSIQDAMIGATPGVEKMTAALQMLAATGSAGGLGQVGLSMDRLHESMRRITNPDEQERFADGMQKPFVGIFGQAGSLEKATRDFEAVDKALAQMVASGNARQAAEAVAQIGVSVDDTQTLLPGYVDALQGAANAAAGSVPGTQEAGTAIGAAGQAAALAAQGVKDFSAALEGLNSANATADQSSIAFAQSLDTLKDALSASGGRTSLLANKSGDARLAFIGSAQAALKNSQAILDQTGSTELASAALAKARTRLINAAVAAGMARSEAEKLANRYATMPNARPKITTPGLAPALSSANALEQSLNRLNGKTVTTYIRTVAQAAPNNVRGGQGNTLGGVLPRAAGGIAQVAPPGTLYQWAEPSTGGEAFIPRRGDRQRSRAIASTVVHDWLGGSVVWPMAAGGIMSFADGGTTRVPLSDYLSRYTPSSFSTREDVTKAARAHANALDRLRLAERQLADDRKRKGVSSAKLAADEAAIARSRRSLATATEKLAKVESSYRLSKETPISRFRRSLASGIKATGAFLANLHKLSERGFRDLALQLLEMGGPEAESIAAGAVKLSDSALRDTAGKVGQAARQQQQLAYFSQISGARAAVKQGRSSFEDLMASTGSSADDLAAALKLIAAELAKTNAGTALLADMRDHGYAAGGIAPPGTRFRWAEPETGGEALVPRFGDAARAKAILSTAAGWYGMSLSGGGGSSSYVDKSVTNVHTVPMNPTELVRELETAKRWRSGRH